LPLDQSKHRGEGDGAEGRFGVFVYFGQDGAQGRADGRQVSGIAAAAVRKTGVLERLDDIHQSKPLRIGDETVAAANPAHGF
jgi:hypothetical protein